MSNVADDGELEDIIKDLVQIETENPPGNERLCSEYIIDWFEERNINAELIEKPYSDRPQVGVRIGNESPTIVLNGHIDVVPAGDIEQWDHDPYSATVEDGKLY